MHLCNMVSPGVFFFHFFKILIFRVVRVTKGHKMAQNDKKICLSQPYLRDRTSDDNDFWYTCAKSWYLQQKKGLNLPNSVCFALYHRNWRSYHRDFDNDISRCFLVFLKKCNIVNIKIILLFIGPFQQFFDTYLFFKFINKCQKEIQSCAPLSSQVCDFFFCKNSHIAWSQIAWLKFELSANLNHLPIIGDFCCVLNDCLKSQKQKKYC